MTTTVASSSPNGALAASNAAASGPKLLAGTMVSTDLVAAQYFYEHAFGFECVRHAPDRLMIRDRFAKAAMLNGTDDFFVIDVKQVKSIEVPQRMCNHWGVDVDSTEEVQRIHGEFKARQAELGITKLMPISRSHGTVSFYFIDRDINWWEVQYLQHGFDNAGIFARGDSMADKITETGRLTAKAKRIKPTEAPDCIVGLCDLTHGTTQQLDLDRAKAFLRDVIGLTTVRHVKPALLFAGSSDVTHISNFAVAGLGVPMPGISIEPVDYRWIVHLANRRQVESVHARALDRKEELSIREIGDVATRNDATDCLLQDAEGNWFQVTDQDPAVYEKLFERGNVEMAKQDGATRANTVS
jgi:catechol 2,3-dioxygenase-like lactoylglutathione lyase family enzyme